MPLILNPDLEQHAEFLLAAPTYYQARNRPVNIRLKSAASVTRNMTISQQSTVDPPSTSLTIFTLNLTMGGFRYPHPVRISGYSVTPDQFIAMVHIQDPTNPLRYDQRHGLTLWGNAMRRIIRRLREQGIAAELEAIVTTPRKNQTDFQEADEWLFWTRIERRKTAPWEEEEVDLEIRQQLQEKMGAPADMKWSTHVVRL
ncbi:hypothetical protein C8R44DRAFT_975663 [Mycena epipterygia]|nr:hypothetical protein C8R44DRAFT_975663 [Mycena epipterygia]